MFQSRSLFRRIAALSLAGAVAFLSPSVSEASSLTDALQSRAAFVLGDVASRSYDGPSYDTFQPFASFVSGDLFALNSLAPSSAEEITFHLLAENGFYAPQNRLGVMHNGNFIAGLPGAAEPGFAGAVQLTAGELYTIALDSPEGIFQSIDANNVDNSVHILAMLVTKPGDIFIPNATLLGASLTFSLLTGDIILFLEDLRVSGNNLYNGIATDADYNDMVVVVRGAAVPEPASAALLLGASLFGIAARRRKNS